MGKATSAGWSLRRVRGGHTHRESRGPSPLGPGGTPLEPALTHSTSGAVTGSNARLGTSKDLSSGHETPYRHSRVHDIRTTLLRLPAAPRAYPNLDLASSQVDRSTISEEWRAFTLGILDREGKRDRKFEEKFPLETLSAVSSRLRRAARYNK